MKQQVSRILKIILLAAITLPVQSVTSWGQNGKFGFYAEVIRRAAIVEEGNGYFDKVEARPTFGFGLGASVSYGDSNRTSLRVMCGLGYVNEITRFEGPGWEEMERGVIYAMVPVHLIFTPLEGSNFGIVTGISPSLRVVGGKDQVGDLNFKRFDLCGDIGLNYKIQTKSISIRPEVRYGYSFMRAVVGSSSLYTGSIDKYLRNKFSLTILLTR